MYRFFQFSFFWLSIFCVQSQENILKLEDYLSLVKINHPIVKQAKLEVDKSNTKLLKSRSGFDPKLELDLKSKSFKDTEYYDNLMTTLKIPTWYGVEFNATYEDNSGKYLNPEYNTPEGGLYSAGVSLSLAKGLLINERTAMLKRAKIYVKQTQANQVLEVNAILYEALKVYFNWHKSFNKEKAYKNFMANAYFRLDNVKKSFTFGDKPAVDTLEASINYKSRKVDYEKARLQYVKSSLELSNFLWNDESIPLEIKENTYPEQIEVLTVDNVLNTNIGVINDSLVRNNPKLRKLFLQKDELQIQKNLTLNNLLPKVNFEYNLLNDNLKSSFDTSNYKSGLVVSIPILMRKERSSFQLAKIELSDISYEIELERLGLLNKIKLLNEQVLSYTNQAQDLSELVADTNQLVVAEQKKFDFGEGSVFLVNYREVKLIESQIKKIEVYYNLFLSKSNLFRILNTTLN